MSGATQTSYPVPEETLSKIAEDVCDDAFDDATDYSHDKAETWNHRIINNFLKALVDESSTNQSSDTPNRKYKYAVTSTVIQHLDPPNTSSTGTSTSDHDTPIKSEEGETNGVVDKKQKPTSGRRGMHSATGAFWNNDTDGMWTYKWEGGEKRGSDVVISVIWVQA